MTEVLALTDETGGPEALLALATAFATSVGADLRAVAVPSAAEDTATAVAACADGQEVLALVVSHCDGGLVDAVEKPVLVVPPGSRSAGHLKRILIAMKGTASTVEHLEAAVAWAARIDVEVVVLHVDEPESVPGFSDQVAHATDAFTEEFRARFLGRVKHARLELRIGDPVTEILDVAKSTDADVVVVGWPRAPRTEGRSVANEILARSRAPVLLVMEPDPL